MQMVPNPGTQCLHCGTTVNRKSGKPRTRLYSSFVAAAERDGWICERCEPYQFLVIAGEVRVWHCAVRPPPALPFLYCYTTEKEGIFAKPMTHPAHFDIRDVLTGDQKFYMKLFLVRDALREAILSGRVLP